MNVTNTTRPTPSLALRRALLAVVALSLSACAPKEIKQYRVARVKAEALPAANAPFTYTAPAAWQKQPGSAMRLASFKTADGGDVSVVTLPAAGGDLKDNVNRWRGQVGLAPISDTAAIEKTVGRVKIDGGEAVELALVSPAGKPDKAMRVVLLEKQGVNWFFKLAGPKAAIDKQAEAFKSFTRSVKITGAPPAPGPMAGGAGPFSGGGAPPLAGGDMGGGDMSGGADMGAGADMSQGVPPMAGGSDMGGGDMGGGNGAAMAPIAPQHTDTRLSYDRPAGWKEKEAGSIRVASFEVSQGADVGDVSIVNLAGDGGGLLSNTNRWRQQLEMAPTDEAGLKNTVKDITVDGNKGYYMALYTGMEGKGMLVALVEQGGETWFIKLIAPSKLARAQEKDFQTFVKSIRFHGKGSQT